MRAFVRVYSFMFILFMMASIGAAAEPSKIGTSIYGFYLGEAKQSLFERAQKAGITYEPKGKIKSQVFPESFRFESSLDKSKQVQYAIVSFHKGHVGQVNIYLTDNSEGHWLHAAQVLDQSWSSYPGYSGQTFGPSFIITIPDVLITLVKAQPQSYITYIHRGMMRTFNEERKKGSR